ncbi:MAG TPA: hypothetical protein PLP29_05620 [Candidatus Ozemobacteraceae bacterium]|nr:hypothetical protein [Candidatus Ozemobacteraceae bacterium]
MRRTRWIAGVFLISLLWASQAAVACSLALHEWQPRARLSFTPSFPLLLLSELDIAREKVREGTVSRVFQVADPTLLTGLLTLIPALLLPEAGWQVISSPQIVRPLFLSPASGTGSAELRHPGAAGPLPASCGSAPLLLGTDLQNLRVVLFSDRRSGNRCHQLVVYETKRIRAIHGLASQPWAREADGKAWISLVFYEYPVPGRILSLSAYPIEGQIREVYSNPELVESLIAQRRLQLRPASAYVPESREIPEMPE